MERRDRGFPKDSYNTIRRIIASSIGKNWNKLYSKIVEKIPKAHSEIIRNTVEREIEMHVTMESKNGKKRYFQRRGEYIFKEFFVHPTTGVLTKTPEYQQHDRWGLREREAANNLNKIEVPNVHAFVGGKHYHKIGDIWYALEMMDFEKYDPITFKEIANADVQDAFISALNKAHEKAWMKEQEDATGIKPNPEHHRYTGPFTKDRVTCKQLYNAAVYCVKYRQLGKKDIHKVFGVTAEPQLPNIMRKP